MDLSRKIRRKMRSPMFWLNLAESDVLDIFGKLDQAQIIGSKDEQCVFIPGKREDKVLLVAHADTVWGNRNVKVNPAYDSEKSVFFSADDNGIGADDRAGCAIIWRLRDSGHSILIPNKEEIGCIGSRALMRNKEMSDKINAHQFAIQFDRRNALDLVTYDVGSDEFIKWCEDNFSGFKRAGGSSTDIRHLCKTMCGVNISCGYDNEHTQREVLYIKQWQRTLDTTRKVLEQTNLPKFVQPEKKSYYQHQQSQMPSYNKYNAYHGYDYDGAYYLREKSDPVINNNPIKEVVVNAGFENRSYSNFNKKSKTLTEIMIQFGSITLIKCRHCNCIQDEIEYYENDMKCIADDCGKEF